MSNNELVILDKLQEIHESIELIQEWSEGMTTLHEFMISPRRVMAYNACIMRLQVIGEDVGKLMKVENGPLSAYPQIPWHSIYGMRNLISHEYANIDDAVVIHAINNDLPKLKSVIEELLRYTTRDN